MVVRVLFLLSAGILLAGVLAAAGGGATQAGATEAGKAGGKEAATGAPERGRAVYFGPGGCANCHAASADPDDPSTGPQLTLENLRAHAAGAAKPLADYVAESILVPNAYAAPGYVRGTMQPPRGLTQLQIEDLVSYLIGKPWTGAGSGTLKLPARPVAACTAKTSCRDMVTRWTKVQRLPAAAVPGAKIFAVSNCLSCHTYAGSGVRSSSAPDLTRAGLGKATVAARVAHLRCPSCVKKGSAMPSYASYGDANLRRIAEFLRASRGVSSR